MGIEAANSLLKFNSGLGLTCAGIAVHFLEYPLYPLPVYPLCIKTSPRARKVPEIANQIWKATPHLLTW